MILMLNHVTISFFFLFIIISPLSFYLFLCAFLLSSFLFFFASASILYLWKVTQGNRFTILSSKTWMGLFALQIVLIPLRKVWIQLFSHQLWLACRLAWILQPLFSNWSRRRKTPNSNQVYSDLFLSNLPQNFKNISSVLFFCLSFLLFLSFFLFLTCHKTPFPFFIIRLSFSLSSLP